MPITEAVLYEYRNMCAGRYGAQWMAIRKLSDKVRCRRPRDGSTFGQLIGPLAVTQ
jgi:hypothetical protein